MTFADPAMLWLALAPVLAALAGVIAERRRDAPDAWPHIRHGVVADGRVRVAPVAVRPTPPWRLWLAMLLVVVALARPQWGEATIAEDAPSAEILIALDLSRSMLAADAPPSRLERARTLAGTLAEALAGRRIGLIGFAGTAHLLAPPSTDRAVLRAFLAPVDPGHIVAQGTDLGAVADTALAAFSPTAAARVLVILSDGEAGSPAWRSRLPALRAAGVRVVAAGVGTRAGATVPAAGGRPMRERTGAVVRSRLTPAALEALARDTGGAYLDAARHRELSARVRAAATGGAGAPATAPRRADRFAWFLGAALLLLAWSAAREWPARPRLRGARRPAVLAGALALTALGPQQAAAVRPPPDREEADPLATVTIVVDRMLRKPRPDAADYWMLAEAATRYGEVHRGHAHPLSEGVLRDGLAAVDAGRRLDPRLVDWRASEAKLRRLLAPPPPVPEDDPSPPDPANEPLGAARRGDLAQDDPREKQEPDEDARADAAPAGLRNVGGSRRDVYDPAEWRNASLVLPLYRLEQLRAADSLAELLRLRQLSAGPAPRDLEQPW